MSPRIDKKKQQQRKKQKDEKVATSKASRETAVAAEQQQELAEPLPAHQQENKEQKQMQGGVHADGSTSNSSKQQQQQQDEHNFETSGNNRNKNKKFYMYEREDDETDAGDATIDYYDDDDEEMRSDQGSEQWKQRRMGWITLHQQPAASAAKAKSSSSSNSSSSSIDSNNNKNDTNHKVPYTLGVSMRSAEIYAQEQRCGDGGGSHDDDGDDKRNDCSTTSRKPCSSRDDDDDNDTPQPQPQQQQLEDILRARRSKAKREYNRIRASKKRQRQKQTMSELQTKVDQASDAHTVLKQTNDHLKSQVALLLQQNASTILNQPLFSEEESSSLGVTPSTAAGTALSPSSSGTVIPMLQQLPQPMTFSQPDESMERLSLSTIGNQVQQPQQEAPPQQQQQQQQNLTQTTTMSILPTIQRWSQQEQEQSSFGVSSSVDQQLLELLLQLVALYSQQQQQQQQISQQQQQQQQSHRPIPPASVPPTLQEIVGDVAASNVSHEQAYLENKSASDRLLGSCGFEGDTRTATSAAQSNAGNEVAVQRGFNGSLNLNDPSTLALIINILLGNTANNNLGNPVGNASSNTITIGETAGTPPAAQQSYAGNTATFQRNPNSNLDLNDPITLALISYIVLSNSHSFALDSQANSSNSITIGTAALSSSNTRIFASDANEQVQPPTRIICWQQGQSYQEPPQQQEQQRPPRQQNALPQAGQCLSSLSPSPLQEQQRQLHSFASQLQHPDPNQEQRPVQQAIVSLQCALTSLTPPFQQSPPLQHPLVQQGFDNRSAISVGAIRGRGNNMENSVIIQLLLLNLLRSNRDDAYPLAEGLVNAGLDLADLRSLLDLIHTILSGDQYLIVGAQHRQ